METLSSGPEPSPARQAVLSVQKLSKRFGALAALNDLSFDVEKGEIFGIAGPNGAGKSTLLNVCTGALAQTSGRIFLDGERVDGLKPYRLCHKGLARTFQIPRLFESMTVHENVATGAMFGVGSESGDGMTMKQLVGDILAHTGLLPSSRHANCECQSSDPQDDDVSRGPRHTTQVDLHGRAACRPRL